MLQNKSLQLPFKKLELLGGVGLVLGRLEGSFGEVVGEGFGRFWGVFREVLGRLWEGTRDLNNREKHEQHIEPY